MFNDYGCGYPVFGQINHKFDVMKHPRPCAPIDAPPGTVELGGAMDWFSASLHVSSDDLQPTEVTALLGIRPTHFQIRGEALINEDGSLGRVPKYGRWTRAIKRSQTDEWNVAEVVRGLFEGLPTDRGTWDRVASLGWVKVSLGLSLSRDSQDFTFEEDLLQLLADRRASVWFDIYREDQESDVEPFAPVDGFAAR